MHKIGKIGVKLQKQENQSQQTKKNKEKKRKEGRTKVEFRKITKLY